MYAWNATAAFPAVASGTFISVGVIQIQPTGAFNTGAGLMDRYYGGGGYGTYGYGGGVDDFRVREIC
jgi:hypothetical protein